MKTITLNGGNYGGVSIQAEDHIEFVSVVASAEEFWIYDANLNSKTKTAEFIGVVDGAAVPVINGKTIEAALTVAISGIEVIAVLEAAQKAVYEKHLADMEAQRLADIEAAKSERAATELQGEKSVTE